MTTDETCMTIQRAVADYTRRTPPHLRDCDMLTGHIVRAIRDAESPATAKQTFTLEQVRNLEEFQRCGFAHPFTCANRGDGKHFDNGVDKGALIPTTRGWICQCCDYTQDWAHDFMLNGSMVRSSPRPTADEVLADVERRLHDMKNLQTASAWPHVEGVAMAERMVRELRARGDG